MPPVIVDDLLKVPVGRHAITIGNFDGVHRGHQLLLSSLRQAATRGGSESLVITFDPLPSEVLASDHAPARLTTGAERARLIGEQGIDVVALIPFSLEFASQEPLPFVRKLVDELEMVSIVVGRDFRFGHDRAGSAALLEQLGSTLGFSTTIIERLGGEEISSTRARQLLANGDVRQAAKVLGRYFSLEGSVEPGDHRGQTLGFPTANLEVPNRLLIPPDGIYCSLAQIDGDSAELPAIVYIGSRPTFGNLSRAVEAYLLDFDDNLYGRRLSVSFIERIRGDMTFAGADELIRQMNADEAAARAILGSRSGRLTRQDVAPLEERMPNG